MGLLPRFMYVCSLLDCYVVWSYGPLSCLDLYSQSGLTVFGGGGHWVTLPHILTHYLVGLTLQITCINWSVSIDEAQIQVRGCQFSKKKHDTGIGLNFFFNQINIGVTIMVYIYLYQYYVNYYKINKN